MGKLQIPLTSPRSPGLHFLLGLRKVSLFLLRALQNRGCHSGASKGRFPSHFHDSRPTSATSSRNLPQCKLPRCEKPVIFDYRINEQREFCDEHIGYFLRVVSCENSSFKLCFCRLVIPVGFAGRCMMCRMPARLDSEFCSEACRCMNAQMEPSGTTGYHQPTVQPAVQEMVQTSATPPPSVRPERTYNLQFQRPWEPESGWDPPV